MIRKFFLYAMFPFLLLAGMTACKSTENANDNAEQRKMCAEVLNAIGQNDYEAFRDICGDLIAEKDFIAAQKNMQQQFGTLTDYRYMATLQTPIVQNDIWIVTFQRKNEKKTENVSQDILFRFVTGKDAEGWKVIGFAFL